MRITKLILITLLFNVNIFAQDSCSELTEDECAMATDCELNYDVAGQFEGCIESDAPPECILDCPGLEDIGPDGNPNELCDWIISINGAECTGDCEEEIIMGLEYLSEACYNCLSDETLDCADVFEDDNGDDGGNDGDGCFENGEWYCYGCELFVNDCEYYECTENGWNGPFENPDCNDNSDDGGWDIECSDINNSEECYNSGCEWTTVTTPNGIFEMCVEPGSGDDGGWNDDGGWEDECSGLSQEDCEYLDYCEWISDPLLDFYGCVESGGWSDDGGWNENGCLADDGDWYCYGCELFINECEYYECTENGWAGPFENPACDDWGCSDLGEEECIQAPDCQPNYDVAGQFEGCVESDGGPPDCLADCPGIENIDPNEDAYETCDWIISNFGPNNFFNECAEDCDEETMMMINYLVEACFDCLSDTTLDCADVFEDEGEDQCSNYSQEDCEYLDYCEWIEVSETVGGQCVEVDPGGDDGGTGGGDGCFENGEWYCYGCEMFINECEYYECTEDGWMGPFESNDCWNDCGNLSQDECVDNPDCTWVWEDDSPIIEDGYCVESDDNPPGDDLVVLSLEHTIGLPGSSVSVPLILNNLETVGGLQFSIGGYNTPNFPGVSVEWFESTNDCFSASYNEVDGQLIGIIFSLEGCSYPPEEHNHIANIIFYVDETAPVGVEVPLWFNYTLASDTTGNEIPSHGEDSSITLGMQGDVNFDGEINILDIVIVVNFAIFIEEPNDSEFWASDINDDGQVNILDIVQLINIILGD